MFKLLLARSGSRRSSGAFVFSTKSHKTLKTAAANALRICLPTAAEIGCRTKIICTIGPATDSAGKIGELVDYGMSVARLNFSHARVSAQEKHRRKRRKKSIGARSVGARSVSARSVGARSVCARSVGARNVGARSVGARSVGAKKERCRTLCRCAKRWRNEWRSAGASAQGELALLALTQRAWAQRAASIDKRSRSNSIR